MTDNGWHKEEELTAEEIKEVKELAESCWEYIPNDELIREIDDQEKINEESLLDIVSESFWDVFPQTAEYANHISPELRRIAGFEDSGIGTFTISTEESEWKHAEVIELFQDRIGELMFENIQTFMLSLKSGYDINILTNQQHITVLLQGQEIYIDNHARKLIQELKIYLNSEPIDWVNDITVCHFCKNICLTSESVINEGGESYCSEKCRSEDNENN